MRTGTMTAAIMIVVIFTLMLPSCKRTETAKPGPASPEQERLKRSFKESKKAHAALVNGEAITMFSLLREMNTIAPHYVTGGQQPSAELNVKISHDALNVLVFQELAVQEAKKRGMKAAPDIIEREIARIKANAGSETAFQKYLGDNGLSESELRQVIAHDALFEMIAAREVDARITVTQEELRERYNKEKSGLKDAAHRQMTFEEAKGLLEQRIRTEAGEKRMREWEKELRKNARIEIVGQTQSSH
jgi:hypothetical protein